MTDFNTYIYTTTMTVYTIFYNIPYFFVLFSNLHTSPEIHILFYLLLWDNELQGIRSHFQLSPFRTR